MLARCAHCRQDFTTERFGVQTCPHCGWQVLLPEPGSPHAPSADANAPQPASGSGPPEAPASPAGSEPGAQPASPPPGAPSPAPAAGGPAPQAPAQPPWAAPSAPWPPPASGWRAPAPVTPPTAGESSPFAQRSRVGLFAAYAQTWRLVAFEAAHFFRRVKTSESRSALLFGVVSFSVGTWVSLLFGWLAGRAGTTAAQRLLERLQMMRHVDREAVTDLLQRATIGGVIGQAVITPLAGVVAIYVIAAVSHVLLLAVRGAPRGFTTTLTTVAYAFGLFLLEALPMCGGIVAIFWFLVVAITGLAESQRCGGAKAAFAVLGPAVLACFCVCACGGWAVVASKLPSRFEFGRSGEGTGL